MVSTKFPVDRPHVVYGVTVGVSAFSLLRGQLAWLRAEGWKVTLVSTKDEGALRAAVREGVQLQSITMTRNISPLADLRAFLEWIRLLGGIRPDAVNVSTPKAALLGGLAAWILRVPKRLYVVRGLRLEGATGFLAKALWIAEWMTMMTATDVLFVSRSLAWEADNRRLLKPGKSWVIGAGSSNGVDLNAVRQRLEQVDPAKVRADLGLPKDAFVVGFIGRIAHDKGIETLLGAMMAIEASEVHLVVIGTAEDEALDRRLDELGSRVRRVLWTDDLWGHLGAIDVLCLPTLREGFPNVVLEAAAAGVPSITTRATGAVDAVLDGETGFLVDVGDSGAVAQRIQKLASDPELVKRLGHGAEQRAGRDFRPERVWAGVDEILRGVEFPEYASRIDAVKIGKS